MTPSLRSVSFLYEATSNYCLGLIAALGLEESPLSREPTVFSALLMGEVVTSMATYSPS